MGWNSWDSYGTTINEAQFKANAQWLAEHLKSAGWQYVVVDMEWFVTNPVEGNSKNSIQSRRTWSLHPGGETAFLPRQMAPICRSPTTCIPGIKFGIRIPSRNSERGGRKTCRLKARATAPLMSRTALIFVLKSRQLRNRSSKPALSNLATIRLPPLRQLGCGLDQG
jgi:hypothetical protein